MKLKLLFMASCILSLSACNYRSLDRVRVKEDTIKEQQLVTLRQSFEPTERERLRAINLVSYLYTKELSDVNPPVYTLYQTVNKKSGSFDLEKDFYLQIDDVKLKKNILDRETEQLFRVNENSKTILAADSSKVKVVTGYNTQQMKQERFKIELTAEDVNLIRGSKSLTYRYYSAAQPATIVVKGRALRQLRKFIAVE